MTTQVTFLVMGGSHGRWIGSVKPICFGLLGDALMTDQLHRLALQAAQSGESLDDLFRRERPDLFRQIKGQLSLDPKHQVIKGDIVPDDEKGGNAV